MRKTWYSKTGFSRSYNFCRVDCMASRWLCLESCITILIAQQWFNIQNFNKWKTVRYLCYWGIAIYYVNFKILYPKGMHRCRVFKRTGVVPCWNTESQNKKGRQTKKLNQEVFSATHCAVLSLIIYGLITSSWDVLNQLNQPSTFVVAKDSKLWALFQSINVFANNHHCHYIVHTQHDCPAQMALNLMIVVTKLTHYYSSLICYCWSWNIHSFVRDNHTRSV